MFYSYQDLSRGSVTIGDGTIINMLGVRTIKLKLISEKIPTLYGVQHVFKIRRNLISGSLLVQLGYKVVLESNKVIISKEEMFIRKYFISEGLFKINILPFLINELSSSFNP